MNRISVQVNRVALLLSPARVALLLSPARVAIIYYYLQQELLSSTIISNESCSTIIPMRVAIIYYYLQQELLSSTIISSKSCYHLLTVEPSLIFLDNAITSFIVTNVESVFSSKF